MVIQVHAAAPRRKSFGENLAAGLASGLGSGISQALEARQRESERESAFERQNKQRWMQNLEAREATYQQQKQMQNALQGLQDLYADPNLSEQQKIIGAYRQLAAHPDLAKQLTGQLGQLSEGQREEDFLSRLMGGGGRPGAEENPQFEGEEAEEPERAPKRRQSDYDPSSWTDKQIDQLRAIKSKSPKAQTVSNLAQQEYDRRQEGKKAKTKYLENLAPFESALETLDQMEKLGKKGNLGIGTKVRGVYSPETRKHAAEYERLGKSLIQYSTNIPIRNRQEFETLAHDLYDPSINDASREGILSAMRRIIVNSMRQFEAPEERGGRETEMGEVTVPTQAGASRTSKERPPLTSFIR